MALKRRTPPSDPSLCLLLPQLRKQVAPIYSTRSVADIYEDIHAAENELECIAEEVRDEHGDFLLDADGCSIWKPNQKESNDFKRYISKLHVAEKERDNLLNLIRHGYMKWVEGNEREWISLKNTSDYYYYVYEGYEVQKKGWWQFSAPLSEAHQAHFEEYLNQYFYYGHPNYQDPRTEEIDTADACVEDGILALYTADKMKQQSLSVLNDGDERDIKIRISLYEEDADSCNTVKSPKRTLANLIKKHHVMV